MNKNLKSINESERNINWEEVENKISIICRKFNNIEERYKDDLAQELRIHAYYVSDDYYDLTRKAIDFWRTLQVKVMPEVPYLDLELLGGMREDDTSVHFQEMIDKIFLVLSVPTDEVSDEVRSISQDIFNIMIDDIVDREPTVNIREYKKYKPYHNQRISCSYLWEVMGDDVGSVHYKKIRKAVKFLERVVKALSDSKELDIDPKYFE